MRAALALFLLASLTFAQEVDLEKARAKVKALEADITAVVARVAPAVGAVSNYRAIFDEKTGKVGLRAVGFGSGLVISRDGLFLTNVHVVAQAARITVGLSDGKTYEAELYADTASGAVKGDIALLRLHGRKRWPFVDWTKGDERKVEPGSFVFAMGNPYGHALDGTPVVTMGIVSGTGRAAAETGYLYLGAVQTDAEINPGNSGGPLFDAKGNFIGINGLMQSRQRGSNSGVGFAIPINQIKRFLQKMMRKEGTDVSYGYHGLFVETAAQGGAVVRGYLRDSPAAEAGLRRGDVIFKVNGKRVKNRSDFVNVVGQLPENRLVRIAFKRGRNKKTASFKLSAQPESGSAGGATQPLPLHERAYLGAEWTQTADGIRITRVIPGAAAAGAKLEAGDILLRLGKTDLLTTKQLAGLLALRHPGTKTRIRYRRDGKRKESGITLGDAAGAAGVVR